MYDKEFLADVARGSAAKQPVWFFLPLLGLLFASRFDCRLLAIRSMDYITQG
jgi:hypothetical protein